MTRSKVPALPLRAPGRRAGDAWDPNGTKDRGANRALRRAPLLTTSPTRTVLSLPGRLGFPTRRRPDARPDLLSGARGFRARKATEHGVPAAFPPTSRPTKPGPSQEERLKRGVATDEASPRCARTLCRSTPGGASEGSARSPRAPGTPSRVPHHVKVFVPSVENVAPGARRDWRGLLDRDRPFHRPSTPVFAR
jgi:hypothetical protein